MANASSKSEHLKTFVIVYLNIILAQHFREPERGTNDIQRCHSKEIKENLDGPVKTQGQIYTDFAKISGKILLFLWETQLFPKKFRFFRQTFQWPFFRQPWFSNLYHDFLDFSAFSSLNVYYLFVTLSQKALK